ncbi:DUF7305 domain-containing protein [Actomonas aquatica]|uniref:DUF7305 domain-containing protein n=1 Tax=Actomonas aquatica TaxID=2866162 RepID=A0ABZ1C6A3_9BACT|nr:hypothetical protein [Opitutus sp. WL0086]WRQ86783.1 hypothetical protein K1X11_018380 [Opitutus sp. WL0086]
MSPAPAPSSPSAGPCSPERGGVLITALIFVALIGVSLVSYMTLTRTTADLSHRSVYRTAAHDLAETGLEHGLWAINQTNDGNAAAWAGWTVDGNLARRKFDRFDFANGVTGTAYVLVENYTSATPTVIARGLVTSGAGLSSEKWLRITTTARSVFAYGLLARQSIVMSGGAWMDSWISNPDNNDSTPAQAWSAGVALENTRLASVSSATPSISIGSADIYGTVSVGASTSAGLAMDWGGQVGPSSMPIAGSYNLAPGALSTNFTASFEDVEVPGGATVRSPYTLPRGLTVAPWYLNRETIGSPSATTILQMDQMTINNDGELTIAGDVILIFPPDHITTLTVTGAASIKLAHGASLTIYTPGNINISGAGVINNGYPKDFQIWSPRTTTGQSITLEGSGALYGVIYAPYADLSLPGDTDFGGSAIVNSANLSGSGAYHFDESLLNYSEGGSMRISNYQEISSAADRAPYLPYMSN